MNIDLHHYDYYKKIFSNNKAFEPFFSQDLYKDTFNYCIDNLEDLLIDSINSLNNSFAGYISKLEDEDFSYIFSVNKNTEIYFFITKFGLLNFVSMKISDGNNNIFSIYKPSSDYFNIDCNIVNIFIKKISKNTQTESFLEHGMLEFEKLVNKNFYEVSCQYLNHLINIDFRINLNRIILTTHLNKTVTLENEYFDFYKFEESIDTFNLKHDIKIISYEESVKRLKLK